TVSHTVKHIHNLVFSFFSKIYKADQLTESCDHEADFGNTTVVNRIVDSATAKLIRKNEGQDDDSVYTEILLAPGYDKEAMDILKGKQKKKMRLIQTTTGSSFPYDVKIIQGLTLVQEAPDYRKKLDSSKVTVETRAQPTKRDR